VDLTRNPEAFTGFAGYNARRIWRSIYDENCFGSSHAVQDEGHEHAVGLTGAAARTAGLCREERVFYRLVSGMHASIAVHLASRFARTADGHSWVRRAP
jgi:hypothetical protein